VSAPTCRYDDQLVARFGGLEALRALVSAPEPDDWSPALAYVRLSTAESGLDQLRQQIHTLSDGRIAVDHTLVEQLDTLTIQLGALISDRDEQDGFLAQQLGLHARAPDPVDAVDPHGHLTPALGRTRPSPQEATRPPQTATAFLRPPSPRALTDADPRVAALVGDIDQLWGLADRPEADPDLRTLANAHIALVDSVTAMSFYRLRINDLTDGRWYMDWPLQETVFTSLDKLFALATIHEARAQRLNGLLGRIEQQAQRDPARAASVRLTAPASPRELLLPAAAAVPAATPPPGSRRTR